MHDTKYVMVSNGESSRLLARDNFTKIGEVLNNLPEEDQQQYAGKTYMPPEKWVHLSTTPGDDDDTFYERRVYLAGIERRPSLKILQVDGRVVNFSYIALEPIFEEEIDFKPKAEALKIIDGWRDRMLEAKSFVSWSDTPTPEPTRPERVTLVQLITRLWNGQPVHQKHAA